RLLRSVGLTGSRTGSRVAASWHSFIRSATVSPVREPDRSTHRKLHTGRHFPADPRRARLSGQVAVARADNGAVEDEGWMRGSSTSLRGGLLALVLERPSHGYELANRLVDRLGETWLIVRKDIYRLLERL